MNKLIIIAAILLMLLGGSIGYMMGAGDNQAKNQEFVNKYCTCNKNISWISNITIAPDYEQASNQGQ
jgi:hypothetical protein